MLRAVLLWAAVCLSSSVAEAQESLAGKPHRGIRVTVAGGAEFLVGDATKVFETGWAFVAGIGYNFLDDVGVELQYFHAYDGGKSIAALQGASAWLDTNALTLNGVFDYPVKPPVSVYVIGGPGVYWRRVTVGSVEGLATAAYCDPFLLFCYPAAVPATTIVGSRTETDFGLNVGLGVAGNSAFGSVFVEIRYHYVFGKSIDTPSGVRHTTMQYLPLTLGARF